jgi:hypothetical protein
MPTGLSKEFVFLIGGITLSFALESQRNELTHWHADLSGQMQLRSLGLIISTGTDGSVK